MLQPKLRLLLHLLLLHLLPLAVLLPLGVTQLALRHILVVLAQSVLALLLAFSALFALLLRLSYFEDITLSTYSSSHTAHM